MRKWLPAIMTLCGYGLSFLVYSRLPDPTALSLERLLPFDTPGEPDLVPRAVAAFGLPSLALLVMLLLHEAPVSPLGRAAGRIMGFGEGGGGGRPVEYHKFAQSYRLIVSWVVTLVLSMHVAVLANALGWYREPGMIVGVALGMGLILVGNIFPRIRPNPVAGIRTRRTMADPILWARVHRVYGVTWVILGVMVVIVALTAPRFALIAGAAALLFSGLAALATPRLLPTAIILAGLSAPITAAIHLL